MMDGIFENGEIVRFTDHSRYRGAMGTVKGICNDYDGIEYYVLVDGDDDIYNYYVEHGDYLKWVSPEELEPDKLELSFKPAFQIGDVVNTPNGIETVREIIITNISGTTEYIYETSPLDSDNKVNRYHITSLEFLYHDPIWEDYFVNLVQDSLPEWRGEIYNLEAFIHYGFEDTIFDNNYQNDTLPPDIMKYILEEYTVGGRINAVLASKKNRREIEKVLNIKPKQLDEISNSITIKIDDRNIGEIDLNYKKKISNKRKFQFTELELSAASEIDKLDSLLGQPRKHFPIEMTNSQIMKSIKEAYKTAQKISKRQVRNSYITKYVLYNKVEPVKGSTLYEGVSKNGLTIRFRYNFDYNVIETAYPVILNGNNDKHHDP